MDINITKLVIVILIGGITYLLYQILKWKNKYSAICKGFAPFPIPIKEFHWLLGHLPYHPGPNEKGIHLMMEWICKFPRYYVFYPGSMRPCLVLYHPEVIKELLKTAQPKPTSFFGVYRLIVDWIGYGLLLSSGRMWYRHRKLLTPAFHFDILKPYVSIYNECTDKLIDRISQLSNDGENSVEIFDLVTMHTLEIIMRCAFSVKDDIQGVGSNNPYVEAVLSLSALFVQRCLNPILFSDRIYYLTQNGQKFRRYCSISHKHATDVIQKRRTELQDLGEQALPKRRTADFLDVLLLSKDEQGNSLTDQEIRDEVETFMFEGHDTTKSAISFILYNLAKHSECQTLARQEVDALYGAGDRDCEHLTWEDLSNMPYLTMVIKESLRLYPPVHLIIRELDEPLTVDGFELAKGSMVDIEIFGLHRNPCVWGDDADTFDPQRFNSDNIIKIDPHAFLPFSAGPRNCIGQNFGMNELKLTVARILRVFDVSVDESVTFELLPEIVLKTKNGINLFFKKRA